MEDLANFVQQSLYFGVGVVSLAVEDTVKTLEEMGEQAQYLAEEAIKQGEAICQELQQGFVDTSQPSEHLRMKLLSLVRGNLETAQRLVNQEKLKNPGMSENWYWEKVIYDLERDYQ